MLKGLFGPKLAEDVKALNAAAEGWASSLGYELEILKTGHLRFRGETAGHRWRLTAGPTSRSYFKHSEIKLGLSAHINPQVQGVICTRRLAALMKQQVYGEATAVADTHALDHLPYEMTTVATQREHPLTERIWEEIACHSDATNLLDGYAVDFLKALPGGLDSLELNTLLPWVVAVQGQGIVLRIGVPSVTLDHVKSALRMQVALIKPLRSIVSEKPSSGPPTVPSPDSLPSR
jgi:hypothetical protein